MKQENNARELIKKQILQGIREAVKEINLVRKGKLKSRDAREVIKEL